MRLVVPPPLPESPRVYVTHAAGPVDPALLTSGLALLEREGVSVERNQALGRPAPGAAFLGGPDRSRARDVLHALCSPSVEALIAARGGYGTMRLLERLPDDLLAERPKWIVGYSDITAIHLWAFHQGVASIHGPMVSGLSKDESGESLAALMGALRGRPVPLPVDGPDGLVGRLIGGNLSLLAAMRPTRWWPHLDGCILFIEEVGEPLYRIDRAIESLRLAGGLERAAGFVVGQCEGCGTGADGPAAAVRLIRERLGELGPPVLHGAPAGHGIPNLAFVHGARYELRSGDLHFAKPEAKSPLAHSPSRTSGPAAVLALAVNAGICSGAQVAVSRAGDLKLVESVGHLSDEGRAPIEHETLFDLASVTKAISTAVLAHLAIEEGRVQLDDRCPAALSVARPTLRDLLRHSSGLPAHVEVFRTAQTAPDPLSYAQLAFAAIKATEQRPVYSDVGYVALGRWVAELFRQPLGPLFQQRIAEPLGLVLRYGPVALAAATERCEDHATVLGGVVHDENAQVLGGVAGHAGLFGSAQDVDRIARCLLGFGHSILAPESVAAMWDRGQIATGGTYTLGWDTPSGPRSNAGSQMNREATVGHLGFTGTSLWIDREAELAITLLTNRVHPSRVNNGIRWLRPAIHDAILKALR